MKTIKQLLTTIAVLLCSVMAHAYDFEVDGIFYNITSDKTVKVTYKNYDEYKGTIEIPATTRYNLKEYNVTSIGYHAFFCCKSLTSVTIPNSVTSIEDEAFYFCDSLTSITIPNNVTSIGDYAFSNCKSLTSITIPNSVTSIGNCAFSSCSSLTSINVDENNPNYTSIDEILYNKTITKLICCPIRKSNITIPNSVTSIEDEAFYFCDSLTSITIPNSVTKIGDKAFLGCSTLTSIIIPNSVTSIGQYAFSFCYSLTSITIGVSVTYIGQQAFNNCYSLTTVIWAARKCTDFLAGDNIFLTDKIESFTITNSVEHIPSYLCYNMKHLSSITIPESVTSIGGLAFGRCSSLSSITIPKSVTSIGRWAFDSCNSLTTIIWNAKKCSDFSSNSEIFPTTITSFIFGNSIEHIPSYLCYNIKNLTSITIPESVISIGKHAFYGCDSLTIVEWNAKKCTNFSSNDKIFPIAITSFKIGNNVEHIPSYLCYDMKYLTSIIIPESITSIGDLAFSRCSSLSSITIPNSTTSIGWSAFQECTSLDSVTIGSSIISIGEDAFTNCDSLKTIIWNAKNHPDLSYNDDKIFPTTITSFIFGDSIKRIQNYLCKGLDNLTSVTIPNSVTEIGNAAFSDCKNLKYVNISDITTWLNIDFYNSSSNPLFYAKNLYLNKEKVTDLIIPEKIDSIKNYTFQNCTSLTTVTIPNSITSIGNYTFNACTSLNSVTIGNSVTKIGSHAFNKCTSLTSIIIPNSVTSIGDYAFNGCDSLTTITWNAKNYPDLSSDNKLFPTNIMLFIFGDSVRHIPSNLCYQMNKLTSVIIPHSVISIGKDAFTKCYSLSTVIWNAKNHPDLSYNDDKIFPATITSFTFGDSINHIQNYLCNGLNKLTSVTIPNSVTTIGKYAFYNCSSLTSITIPNSITSIETSAFYGCSSLTSITLPNSVTSIETSAFYGCSSLTSITLPNSVTSIKYKAFSKCTSLNSVIIGNSVTIIEGRAFEECKSLTSIIIPNSVTIIEGSAFVECSSLESVTIGNSVSKIEGDAFSKCNSLTTVIWNAKNCADFPNTYDDEWEEEDNEIFPTTITSFTFGDSVEYIPNYLCDKMDKLTSIIIPNSTNSIGKGTFADCSSLVSITIPNSITKIGAEAFKNCNSLKSVNISNIETWCNIDFQDASSNPLSYAKNLYLNGEKVVNLIIPEGVNSINYTFKNCTHLQSVTIPNSITQIGEETFNGCNFLTTIVWNAKNCADFSDNDKQFPTTITSFTIGDSVEHIPSYLCSNMEILTSITVNATTPPTLGKNAFHKNLKYVYIPDNTISAYKEAWGTEYIYINNETSVNVHVEIPGTLADEIVELGKRPIHILNLTVTGTLNDDDFKCIYETMTSLLTVDLYDITNTIGINFNGKSQLQKVVLPQCLTKIEERTFANCSALTSITIPSQVKSIGANAFIGCSKLDTITCLGLTPPEADNLGLNLEKCILIVSSVAYKDYLKHAYWGQFLNIKTIDINYKNLSVVANNNEWGTIMGAGAYIENEKAILTATANKGYQFKEWSDGNTENPRIIVVTEDIELTAIFEEVNTPVENTFDNQIGIYSINGTLHIEGLESDYQIYTTTGQFIYSGKQTTLTLPRGIYLIVINGKTHKIAL